MNKDGYILDFIGYGYKPLSENSSEGCAKYVVNSNCVLIAPFKDFEGIKVTSMEGAFAKGNVIVVDFEHSDLSNITVAREMFEECEKLEIINFGEGFKNLKDSSKMFYYADNLKRIKNLKNDAKHEDSSEMFSYCICLEEINLSEFRLGTYINSLFSCCFSLRKVTLYKSKTDETELLLTKGEKPFYHCNSLKEINLNDVRFGDMSFTKALGSLCSLRKVQSNKMTREEAEDLMNTNKSIKEIKGKDFTLER